MNFKQNKRRDERAIFNKNITIIFRSREKTKLNEA